MLREYNFEDAAFASYRTDGALAIKSAAQGKLDHGLSVLSLRTALRWKEGERLEDVLEAATQRFSDRTAVATAEGDTSYRDLNARANAMARYLINAGVRPGDRVAVLLDRGLEAYVALFALLKARATYVPLDPNLPAERIGYIVADSQVSLILAHRRFAGRFERMPLAHILIDEIAPALARVSDAPLSAAEKPAEPNAICYILYTSGTTGRPKGVMIGHPSICNFVRVAAERYGFAPGDRVYQGMSVAFDFSIEELWVPLAAGAALVPNTSASNLFGEELADFLEDRGVTCFCCVPTLLASIERDLPQIRVLLVGGEACPPALVNRWGRPGRNILNSYGPTEATVTATLGKLSPGKPVTIGRPLPTYSIVILDAEKDEALPMGAAGELGIGGIGLALGYLNRDDLTNAKFIPDFLDLANNPSRRIYRTGDLARINDEGEIEYLGRIDTQVKIRGYRIELTEIESVLLEMPEIAQAVVTIYEPTPGANELAAYYAVKHGVAAPERSDILCLLKARLPSYMVPAYLERLPFIPTLVSNKADRATLPAPKSARVQASDHIAPPRTETERRLAAALGAILGVEQVSVGGHFFNDFGAHSLLMARFCAKIRQLTPPLNVAMRDIYTHTSVRQLAEFIDAREPLQAMARDAARLHIPSNLSYYGCGSLQLLFYAIYGAAAVCLSELSLQWTAARLDSPLELFIRCASVAAIGFVGLNAFAIAAKWALLGRVGKQSFEIWSLRYFRFWLVKFLVQTAPAMIFVGTPLFNVFLRLLGARIGKGAVILSRNVPIAADLFTAGDDAFIAKHANLRGYRAILNRIEIDEIRLGHGAYVGETSVLDIGTAIGDGAQLGHASSLQQGQRIPDGKRYCGSPAQETQTNFCDLGPLARSRGGRGVYAATQLAGFLLFACALPDAVLSYGFGAFEGGAVDHTSSLLTLAASLALPTLGWSLAGYAAFLGISLLAIYAIPRLCNAFLDAGKVYPLYGFHYGLQSTIEFVSNSTFFNLLFGDSVFIERYLRFVGWRIGATDRNGSNFGTSQRHDNPFLCNVGPGTVASDGLAVGNKIMSSRAFKLGQATIGGHNFIGTDVYVPLGARIGDNCMLGTKVMAPIDGPVRENVGLLGSSSFEIPRAVGRDLELAGRIPTQERERRVAAKTYHNVVSGLALLAIRALLIFASAYIFNVTAEIFGKTDIPALVVATGLSFAASAALLALTERASIGFRRLTPMVATVYDPYFWQVERYWKLSDSPLTTMFAGTPLRNLVLRLAGVNLGRKVFDDGCTLTERTLIEIGDYANLNAGSSIQAHSLEEGVFKSDRVRIGDGCSLGVGAFVHYGVTMHSHAILDADSFLMKGEIAPAHSHWRGNPAKLLS